MKKSIFLLCGMLCCFQAFSQEAEESDTQWLIIPRVDVNPYARLSSNGLKGFDWGSTSLYTTFDGGIGESNFSYSVEAHWLSTDTKSLYDNTFRSDDVNWLDWANITYSLGNFDFTLGKDCIKIGTFEINANDFDSFSNLNSTVWNNASIYQWGGSVGYNFDDGSSNVALQVTSSPFNCHPFSKWMEDEDGNHYSAKRSLAYSLAYTGDYESLQALASVNVLEDRNSMEENAYVLALGAIYKFSDTFSAGADIMGLGWKKPSFKQEGLFSANVTWNACDRFSLTAKAGYEYCGNNTGIFDYEPDGEYEDSFVPTSLWYLNSGLNKDFVFGGLQAIWYPFAECENFRVHAVVSANNFAKSLSFNVGATYYFDIRKLF